MPKQPPERGPSNEIVLSDFFRKGPRRIILAVGVLLAVTLIVGAVVYSGLWSSEPAGEAHAACHDAITGQLEPDLIQFVDETTDESTNGSGGTDVIVRGTAEIGWSAHHAYTCTYSDGKLIEANLD